MARVSIPILRWKDPPWPGRSATGHEVGDLSLRASVKGSKVTRVQEGADARTYSSGAAVDVSDASKTVTRTQRGVSDRRAPGTTPVTMAHTEVLDTGSTWIMHSRGQGRCGGESKYLGQQHFRPCLTLKRWTQVARPGRPGGLVGVQIFRMGQAQSPSRQSPGGPAGGATWFRRGLTHSSASPRRRLGHHPPAGRPRAGGSPPAGARVACVQVRGRSRRRCCHPGSGHPGCRGRRRTGLRC
jgi:hypothetical protein